MQIWISPLVGWYETVVISPKGNPASPTKITTLLQWSTLLVHLNAHQKSSYKHSHIWKPHSFFTGIIALNQTLVFQGGQKNERDKEKLNAQKKKENMLEWSYFIINMSQLWITKMYSSVKSIPLQES